MSDDQGTPQEPQAQDTPDPLAGLSAEQQAAMDARLRAESDRLDMRFKDLMAKREAELRETINAELAEKQKLEQMDELERTKAELEKERAQREAERARVSALEAEVSRAEFLAANAADLPQAYRAQVQGDDEEALGTALTAARQQWEADLAAHTGRSSVGTAGRPPVTGGTAGGGDDLSPYQKLLQRTATE